MPQISLFRDDIFKKTCKNVQDRNESRVIHDITRLIVPSAETLATYGATKLECLIESVNEGWNDSIPVTKTRPQPDYAVGFRREAFTSNLNWSIISLSSSRGKKVAGRSHEKMNSSMEARASAPFL